jgi:serine/threonine-protein kinase RsbW
MTSKPTPSCEFNSRELLLRLDVLVAADISAIGPLVERVMEIARDMKCAEGKEFEIEMALREALANAIVHGAKHDASKNVQLCVACDESRGMLIVVRDPGEGFNPQSVPSPVMGQNLFSEHGRGIFLINQLMDEVRFERGGTEIHMKKA